MKKGISKMETGKLDQDFSQFNWCGNYIQYLDFRERGLRKEAVEILKQFCDVFKFQNKTERRLFVDHIYKAGFFGKDYSLYMPVNFYREILLPELELWITEEPANPIPYKWTLKIDMVRKSLELDPYDPIASELLIDMAINKISLNQHEIPFGYPYVGNVKEDIELINYCEKFIDKIKNPEKKESIKTELSELKECAQKFN